ncbi:MAG: alpha-galactosidase [Eubacteriales bacterium]
MVINMIQFQNNTFILHTNNTSYIMLVDKANRLYHTYYGKKLDGLLTKPLPNTGNGWCFNECSHLELSNADTFDSQVMTLDPQPMEYPTYGHIDLRAPAFQVERQDGTLITDFRYHSHEIVMGKPALKGLPSMYDENNDVETLCITLVDDISHIAIELSYSIFQDSDVICRSNKIINNSDSAFTIDMAHSVCMDFNRNNFDVLYLEGSWARERHLARKPLTKGKFEVQSNRGGSSHQMNPFVAVCDKDTTETSGEVWGFNLVYSGNHSTTLEVDMYDNARLVMGVNPFQFKWELEPNDSFQTPECVLCYSADGLGDMSRIYHDAIREHLVRGEYKHKKRPILINNWEATYFDFDEEKIMNIASKAQKAGIELMVLDDGWFGKRDIDNCSLGDWYVHKTKLPSGIAGLADRINQLGMEFGLWFEPEMVNPDSDLYRAHPDWAITTPGYQPTLSRSQLVLDLANPAVCDYIIKSVSDILSSANISYVKWDMNRHIADMPYKGYNHKYILGLYHVLETITSSFPHVLFESCSGGGGRYDSGMLHYMPQTWCSDDTDAIERSYIQYGTSMCYPLSTMGAHVTTVPNHITSRVTPLSTRFAIALSGNFGYELDITQVSDEDFADMTEQIKICKEVRELMHTGDFYRLRSPFEENTCAWEIVAKDKSEAIICFTRILNTPFYATGYLKLQGLEAHSIYEDLETKEQFYGSQLMYMGIQHQFPDGDFQSIVKRYAKISS